MSPGQEMIPVVPMMMWLFCFVARGADASDGEGAQGADAADGEGGSVGWVRKLEVSNAMLSGGSFQFDCFFFLPFDASLPFFHVPCFGSVALFRGGLGSLDSASGRSFSISAAFALSYAIQPLWRGCLCGRRVAASTLTFLGMTHN